MTFGSQELVTYFPPGGRLHTSAACAEIVQRLCRDVQSEGPTTLVNYEWPGAELSSNHQSLPITSNQLKSPVPAVP